MASFRRLLAEELALTYPAWRAAFEQRLTPPRQMTLHWEYGSGEPYQAWDFADFGERDVHAAYCRGGHGELGSPWGLVFANSSSFGMDSGWFRTLDELLEDWYSSEIKRDSQ